MLKKRIVIIIIVGLILVSVLIGTYYYYYHVSHSAQRSSQVFTMTFPAELRDMNTYNYTVILAPYEVAAKLDSIIGQHMRITMNVKGTLNTTSIIREVSRYAVNGWVTTSLGGGVIKDISFKDTVIKPYFSEFRPYIYIIYYMHNSPAKIALILSKNITPNETLQAARELRRIKGLVIIFVGDTIISLNYQVSTYTQHYTTCTGSSCSTKNPMTIKRLMITAYIIGNTGSNGEHTFTVKLRNITLYYYRPSNILSVEEEKTIRLNNTVAVYLGEKLVIIDHSDNYENQASWTIKYGSNYIATFTIYADKPSGEPIAIISLDGKELVRIYFNI